jgi:hypothetical protein
MPRISFFGGAVEHRGGEGHALGQLAGHLDDVGVAQRTERFLLARAVVQLSMKLAQFGHGRFLLQHVADAVADALGGPAQVHFEHLAHVHARRHAQRVQHDVARRAVGHVGHVFDRTILDTTPLLPWRPAILSPGCRRRLTAR